MPHLPSCPIPTPPPARTPSHGLSPTNSRQAASGKTDNGDRALAERIVWGGKGSGGRVIGARLRKSGNRARGGGSCRQRGWLRLRYSSVKILFTATLPTTRAAQAAPLSLSLSLFFSLSPALSTLPHLHRFPPDPTPVHYPPKTVKTAALPLSLLASLRFS